MSGRRGGLLLGVDVGTPGAKGVLVRPDGEAVATAERPHHGVYREQIPRLAGSQKGNGDVVA